MTLAAVTLVGLFVKYQIHMAQSCSVKLPEGCCDGLLKDGVFKSKGYCFYLDFFFFLIDTKHSILGIVGEQ